MNFIDSTRKNLSDYITENGKTQSGVSKEMNVSDTTLSQFLSNIYPGDNEAVAQKAAQYLELGAARKRMAKAPPFCSAVENTIKILTAVKMAHEGNDVLLMFGPSGCSKTTTLRGYAQQTNGAIYVEADATTGSQRNILISIMEALGKYPVRISTAQMMRDIISRLSGTNGLLIIDEAQHLNERAFDTLRAINDKAGIGIVFSGNRSILKRMFGRLELEYDQLYSRVGVFCELKNKYALEEISKMYKGICNDKQCLEYLHRTANQKGGLRRMVKHYKLAVNIADTLEQNLSVPILMEADKRISVTGRNFT